MKRARVLAAALAVLAPPAAALGYIYAFGVNAAHWDHLTNAELFDRFYRGTLTVDFLLRPHLEHIKLFPRLTWLALGVPSRFNNLVEIYAQWAILCAAAGLLYLVVRRRTGLPHSSLIPRYVPVTLLLFTPRQHEALLVGDGMIAYLCVAGGLAALALLDRGGGAAVPLAAGAAFVASFSHANGFLLWPIGALMLAARPAPATLRRAAMMMIWIGVAAAAVILYALHWPGTAARSLTYAVSHPGQTLAYAIAAAGTPFGQDPWIQLAFGGCALAVEGAAIALAWRAWRRGAVAPFGAWLILFALGVQLLIALGRTEADPGIGIPSRYAVFIGLGIAGAYLTGLELAGASGGQRLTRAAAIVILAGSIPGYAEGLASGPIERDARLRAAHVLRSLPLQTDEAIEDILYPFALEARAYGAALERWRLNVFAHPLRGVDGLRHGAVPAKVFLDQVNFQPATAAERVVFTAGRTIGLSGWAFDQQTWRPFESGYLRLQPSGLRIPLAYGLERTDVAATHQVRGGAALGYAVTFSSDVLQPGDNSVTLELIAKDANRFVETPPIAILTRR